MNNITQWIHSNPIQHILNCIDCGVKPTEFDILNAKDQLKAYERSIDKLTADYYQAKQHAREDRSRWLDAERDRAKLAEENKLLKESLNNAVAFARINGRGDLYDLRLQYNPHVDETTVLPLYSNKEEFKRLTESLKNA
jgi:hypothetical protein